MCFGRFGKPFIHHDIKIHNADPDAYSWVAASPADNDVAKLESMRMIAKDGQLYLWGSKNGTNVVMTRKTREGVALWTKKDISGTDGLQTKSINLFNGKFVAISESGLWSWKRRRLDGNSHFARTRQDSGC
ncbi:MAG: DUF6242 domain-containing protein [Bacteroidaceae bacterium]